MKDMKSLGKMTLSEAMPSLQMVAENFGLKLNRMKEFKTARLILANLYCNG